MKAASLTVIFLTVFLDLVGFGIVLPLLPLFGKSLNASPFAVTMIMMVYSLAQFLLAPVWGRFSDRFGRRPIILISLFGSIISYLLFAFATSTWMIFLSRLFAGVCGANISVANAYIADITTPENRSKGMGIIGAAFGLGFIFGPAIGGLTVDTAGLGYHLPGFVAAALCAVNFILALFVLPESLDPEKRSSGTFSHYPLSLSNWSAALSRPKGKLYIFLFFLFTLGFTVFESMFAWWFAEQSHLHFIQGNSAKCASYLFAYMGFVVAMIQGGFIGRLVTWLGEIRLVALSNILLSASFFMLAMTRDILSLFVVLLLLGIANGMNRPALFGLISLNSKATEQGAILGVTQSAGSLARIIGFPLSGLMYQNHPNMPLFMASAVLAFAWILSLTLLKQPDILGEKVSDSP